MINSVEGFGQIHKYSANTLIIIQFSYYQFMQMGYGEVVERFSLNPNWVGTTALYLVQKVIQRCLMIVSNILFKGERIDIGR